MQSMEEMMYEGVMRTFQAKGLGEYEIAIFNQIGQPQTLRGRVTDIGLTSITMSLGGNDVEIRYSPMRFYDRKDYPLPTLTGSRFLK